MAPDVTERKCSDLTRSIESYSRDQLLDLLEALGEGGIRISFSGKPSARRLARRVRPRVTKRIADLGFGDPEARAQNMLIEGDNLQTMVTLYKERGSIDFILTDPPYNTGNDFRYNDRWEEDPNDPGIGEFVSAEDGARHTKWMRFMWPRLQMMKAMLRPGGVLAICIDHRELFRLGQMLDELFDDRNRLAIINWQRAYTRTNDAEHVATTTEYILVYAKNSGKAQTRLLPRDGGFDNGKNLDADPKGWTDAPATGSNAKAHMGMVYGIQSPFTGEVHYPPMGSAWRQGQDKNLEQLKGWGCNFELLDLEDEVERARVIGVSVHEVPAVKAIMLAEPFEKAKKKAEAIRVSGIWPKFYFLKHGKGRPRLKKHFENIQPGLVPTTYWADEPIDVVEDDQKVLDAVSWPHQISGHSQRGVTELTNIVGRGHEFKTVKPLKLFTKLVQIWCRPDGVVLDPFAGSGTTGHAVLALNREEENSSRRFILIEQGRPERGDSYAQTLTADRLRRVCSGDWAKGQAEGLGCGFEFIRLGKKVDSSALLQLERDEMCDTVIGSHFDANRRRGDRLIRIENGGTQYRYLVAKNADNEGFFLVWDGPNRNTDFTEDVYETCTEEAERTGLSLSQCHVYARLYRYQTEGVKFYQIPDRILSDFGLDTRSEPFAEIEQDEEAQDE